MSADLFYKILREVTEVIPAEGIVALSYAGESLLHPRFREFAEAFTRSNIKRRQIVTNGLLLDTSEHRQTVIDNFAEIAVSIHNVPELAEVLENLRCFKVQLGGADKPYFRTNIVEEEFRTKYQMAKIMKLLEGWGIEIKLISAITEDLCRYVEDVAGRDQLCFAPYYYMGILWNGDVLPCCHILSSAAWTLGNVSRRTLQEVFDDEPYRNLRTGLYEGTHCARCTVMSCIK